MQEPEYPPSGLQLVGASEMDSLYEVKARIVRILAHPRRLEIVELLGGREWTVTEIADAVHLSQSGTSQHLAALRRVGIVEVRRDGAFMYYRLADQTIGAACRRMNDAVVAVLTREQQIARPILAAATAAVR